MLWHSYWYSTACCSHRAIYSAIRHYFWTGWCSGTVWCRISTWSCSWVLWYLLVTVFCLVTLWTKIPTSHCGLLSLVWVSSLALLVLCLLLGLPRFSHLSFPRLIIHDVTWFSSQSLSQTHTLSPYSSDQSRVHQCFPICLVVMRRIMS